jgi:hypothetical protein
MKEIKMLVAAILCNFLRIWFRFQLLQCSSGVARIILNLLIYLCLFLALKWANLYSPQLTVAYCAPHYDLIWEADFSERVRVLEAQNIYGLPPQNEAGGYSNRIISSLRGGNPLAYRSAIHAEFFQLQVLEQEAKAQTILVELANSECASVKEYFSAAGGDRTAFSFLVTHFHLFGNDFNYNVPTIMYPFENRPFYCLENRNLVAEISHHITSMNSLGRSAPLYRAFRSFFTGELVLLESHALF